MKARERMSTPPVQLPQPQHHQALRKPNQAAPGRAKGAAALPGGQQRGAAPRQPGPRAATPPLSRAATPPLSQNRLQPSRAPTPPPPQRAATPPVTNGVGTAPAFGLDSTLNPISKESNVPDPPKKAAAVLA